MAKYINDLNQKQDGVNGAAGMLTSNEWNTLVDAVIENQQAVNQSIKGIIFNNKVYDQKNDQGLIEIDMQTQERYSFTFHYEIKPATVISKGSPCIVKFKLDHTEKGEISVMPVTAKFFCNGRQVGVIENLYDQSFTGSSTHNTVAEFDFSKATELSTSESGNLMWIEVENSKGGYDTSATFSTRVIDMSLDVELDGGVNGQPVFTRSNQPNLKVSVSGGKALLTVKVDNEVLVEESELNANVNYSISGEVFNKFNTHGIHELVAFVTPVGYEDIRIDSDPIKYIYGDSSTQEVPTPIIMTNILPGTKYEEYNNLLVNYVAYYEGSVGNNNMNIFITKSGVNINNQDNWLLDSGNLNINFTNNVGQGSYIFNLFPKDSSQVLVGNSLVNIKLGSFIDSTAIEIIKSSIPLNEAAGYVVYLTSRGKSNDKDDRNIWECSYKDPANISAPEIYTNVTFDETIEFNTSGSGWRDDSDGNVAMHLRKGKYFTLNHKPFAENPVYNSGSNGGKGTGKTISIEFATRNCLKQNAVVIDCTDPETGYGFKVYANRVELISNNKTLTCNFKEDERIKLDLVIEGKLKQYDYSTNINKKPETGTSYESLMIIFINGVYQRLELIPDNTTFVQSTPQNIKFGSDLCELDVYNIRIYNQAINIDDVVKNYAYDTPKHEDRIEIAKRNDIFTNVTDNMPKIDIQKLRNARKDLPFVYVKMTGNEPLPADKDNWYPLAHAAWVNPNNESNEEADAVSWETKYGVFRNQGTSSMNYAWPWRNWDFKLDKYKDASGEKQNGFFEIPTLNSGKTAKKWKQYAGMPGGIAKITLKKDYASSEMCNNAVTSELFTDMANALGSMTSYTSVLSPTQQQNGGATSNYRLTFKATPCFMFQTLQDNTNEGMGMMNLIPNKNECEYLGFLKNQWEDGEDAPRAQSWEISENHIFYDFPIETVMAKDRLGIDDDVMVIDGVIGYYAPKMVDVLDENGEPVKDGNGNVVQEQESIDGILQWTYLGNFKNGVANNYEARYPKDSSIWDDTDFGYTPEGKTDITEEEYIDLINEQADLINFHNWLVSTNRCLATNKRLDEIPGFTAYEEWNTDATGKHLFEVDTIDYRKKKFEMEAPQRLLIDQWILYYIWREQFWMFDSGAKNLQLYTMDGEKWGCMVRDADTAMGIDNLGVDMFPPHLEDIDYYTEKDGVVTFHYGGAAGKYTSRDVEGSSVLNGQYSAIWLNIRDVYSARIAQMYRDLSTKSTSDLNCSYFSAEKSIKRFDDHQAHWSESLYNFGMRQYFGGSPFSAKADAANGDKKQSRKSWLEKGFFYRKSKYNDLSDYFNFRGIQYKSNDARGNSVGMKTYIPMYIATGGATSTMQAASNKFRVTDPDTVVNIPIGSRGMNVSDAAQDQNCYVYGSSQITDLGDFARYIECKDIVLNNADMKKLTSLRLGDHTNTYTKIDDDGNSVLYYNGLLSSLDCNKLPSLTFLDITRHTHLSDFKFNECDQLEEFYASGTDSISNLTFPQTSTLKTIRIGAGLKTLTMENLTGIQEFTYDGLNNIQLINISNCGPYMAKESYKIVRDCLPSLETSYNSGVFDTVYTLHGIDWKNVSEDVINRLLNIGLSRTSVNDKQFGLKGTIQMSSLSYETKVKLKTAYGDIDNEDNKVNSIYVIYNDVDIEDVTMPAKIYAYDLGRQQLTFTPKNPKGNNFVKTEWEMIGGSNFATIDKNTGVLNVTSVGTEETHPTATVKVTVTVKDGTQYVAESEIHFYQRSCKLGDYVFSDGSYNDELITRKTPIGVCFYIDPKNPENRLMVSLKNITTTSNAWGLLRKYQPNIPDWDMGGVDGVGLEGDPEYSCYDISKLENITAIGETIYYHEDKNGDGKDEYYEINTMVPEIYKTADGDFKEYSDRFTMYGDLGWQETMNRINYGGVDYKRGAYIPSGLYNTLCIMEHRDKILSDFEYEIPSKTDNSTELQRLSMILRSMGATNPSTSNKHYLMYYPAASYAYAYSPVTDESKLDERFKSHKWFLPAIGDVIRLTYHSAQTEGEDAIFAKAIADGQFDKIDEIWSSTEYGTDQACKTSITGYASGSYKNSNITIRPICMF